MKNSRLPFILTCLELALYILAVALDLLIPTVVIIVLGFIFLLLKKVKISELGFRRQEAALKMILGVFCLTVVWTLVDFGLILPILNRLTGTTQDVSGFADLKGNMGELLFMLAASWTLAAVGEELAYRGFVQKGIRVLFNNDKAGIIMSVILASILFGFAHTEQGVIGVIITAIDALFFNFVRYRYKNLWASVLAHGFMNSIGVITFYFTGPLYGLW